MAKPIKDLIIGETFPFINNAKLHNERGYASFPENKEPIKVLSFVEGTNSVKVYWFAKSWEFTIDLEYLEIPEEYFEEEEEEDEKEEDE